MMIDDGGRAESHSGSVPASRLLLREGSPRSETTVVTKETMAPRPVTSAIPRWGGAGPRKSLVGACVGGAAVAVAIFSWLTPNVRMLHQLAEAGTPVQAEVVATHPKEHENVDYRFTVNGVAYAGTWGASYGNPVFSKIASGNRVLVYYLPQEPRVSVMGKPRRQYEDARNSRFLATLFAFFATAFFSFISTNRRRPANAT